MLLPVSPLARGGLSPHQELTELSSADKDQDPTCKESVAVEKVKVIMHSLLEGDDESESLLSDYRHAEQAEANIPRPAQRRPLAAILV